MPKSTSSPPAAKVSRRPELPELSGAERQELGRSRREQLPRAAHAEWSPAPNRDVLALLQASNQGRVPELVPIRHTRMLASPFAFYRGAPAVMAYDLGQMPSTGLYSQLCGDCHIANFGMYASPERTLVFDLNDFDETLPGPFEWDVKRTAASIVVAARSAGISPKDAEEAVGVAVRVYREKMREFAERSYLATWYSEVKGGVFLQMVDKADRKTTKAGLARAQARNPQYALDKLTEVVDGKRRFVHNPPYVFRLSKAEGDVRTWVKELFTAYHASLEDSRKTLLARYRLMDVAHKVAGVGSVGTRCFISYWQGSDERDALFLQLKQANASLLEPYLGRSEYEHPGRRVVTGQRLMQATSDIFLGYTRSGGDDYFVRQLYDAKGSVDLEDISAVYLARYAGLCGAVLARAHARTGDPAQIGGYLGKSDRFDKALVHFASAYADQNDADYAVFRQAVAEGKLPTLAAEPAHNSHRQK